MKGLEPPRLAALDPKSSVYTNFTTSAFSKELFFGPQKYPFFSKIQNLYVIFIFPEF